MIYIFCAPSGSGKSTMVKHLLTMHPDLFELSVSCTTRAPRGQEVHGREYYFISVEEFQKRIENDDFIEYEQVYDGLYYGTLKEEIDRNRLEQEMIYYLEKLDITEEKVRLTNHIKYFREVMGEGLPVTGVGKKLGFIAQEMGREINTLGSKSNQSEMQIIVVKMKDILEQIKEQVLNVL